MKTVIVYSNPFLPNAKLVTDHLQRAGVDARLRNGLLTGMGGGIGFTDAFAEVHVPAAQAGEAADIVRTLMGTEERGRLSPGDDRDGALSVVEACASCSAEREPGFDVCWQCGEAF